MSDLTKKRITFLAAALLTFLALVSICHIIFKIRADVLPQSLEDHWYVEYNDRSFEDVSLRNLRSLIGSRTKKGDVISMTTTITSQDSLEFPSVAFLSYYSAVEVLLDDDVIFSQDFDRLDKGFIGVHLNLINLEPQDGDCALTIRYYVNENNSYSQYEPPLYGGFREVVHSLFFINMFALASGIFLIIFGMVFFLITLAFYKTLPDIMLQLFSALFFIDLGIWILCYFRLSDIFIYSRHLTELEYITLYLMVPLIYCIIGCIQKHYSDWTFNIIAATSGALCAFLALLHFTGLAHMNVTLIYFHLNALLCATFLVATIGRDIYQKKLLPSEKIQLAGIAFLIFSFILSLISYELEQMRAIPENLLSKHSIPMGGLIFVFVTLINYFIYISESYARRKEYSSLTHLAYADGLTNLPNRSRYEKYLSDLDSSDKEYCIISLDLNGLKQINDNSGHSLGDKYLQEFGAILQQCFADKAFLARIGGDEFVAIMTEENWHDVDTILTRLRDALEVKNVLYPEYRRSVATGYAFSNEVPDHNSHSVYLLADKRMYQNKKKMHEKMGTVARI